MAIDPNPIPDGWTPVETAVRSSGDWNDLTQTGGKQTPLAPRQDFAFDDLTQEVGKALPTERPYWLTEK